MYTLVKAMCLDGAGILTLLFPVGAGVLQGCPLSGLLFALASDAILNSISKLLSESSGGAVAACADDIAIAIKSIAITTALSVASQKIERISKLALSIPKCMVIPLNKIMPGAVVVNSGVTPLSKMPLLSSWPYGVGSGLEGMRRNGAR